MDLNIWGARGSIPSPLSPEELEQKLTHALVEAGGRKFSNEREAKAFLESLPPLDAGMAGGNTSCVEITSGKDQIILDAGSGLRTLGQKMMARGFAESKPPVNILISHTHWDHICGFPFFVPVFIDGSQIHIYGCHDDLEERFRNQHHPYNFPVLFDQLAADIAFTQLQPADSVSIAGFDVSAIQMVHPGDSFAYRIERDDASVVYATDAAYNDLTPPAMKSYHDFFDQADVLIFDAFFDDLIDSFQNSDWGHSSAFIGVDIALNADVQKLILFHHDHLIDDDRLQRLLDSTHNYLNHVAPNSNCEVLLALEGLTIQV